MPIELQQFRITDVLALAIASMVSFAARGYFAIVGGQLSKSRGHGWENEFGGKSKRHHRNRMVSEFLCG